MQTITPFLWYNDQAEEAVAFYLTLFDGEVLDVSRKPDGSAFVITWRMGGAEYRAINGGPHYALSPAFSLSAEAADQARIDELWDALTANGVRRASAAGWSTASASPGRSCRPASARSCRGRTARP